MTMPSPSRSEDIHNPIFARIYHRMMRKGEPEAITQARHELLDNLAGRVIEVGAGDGANFALYPPTVSDVVAVEPEPYLREHATQAASAAPVPVAVKAGRADQLPVEDASSDAVVFALVLCSVPDQAAALAEARRVLRPGGQLRVFEHVVAKHPLGRTAQQVAQATIWPRIFGNCHPARDTLAAIRAAGFETSDVRRFVLRPGPMAPPTPHIVGTATVPRHSPRP